MAEAPRTMAMIEWVDAGIVATRWEDEAKVRAEGARLQAGTIRSAGLLLETTGDHVILALSYNQNNDDVALAEVIPRSAIRRMDIWSPFPPEAAP